MVIGLKERIYKDDTKNTASNDNDWWYIVTYLFILNDFVRFLEIDTQVLLVLSSSFFSSKKNDLFPPKQKELKWDQRSQKKKVH